MSKRELKSALISLIAAAAMAQEAPVPPVPPLPPQAPEIEHAVELQHALELQEQLLKEMELDSKSALHTSAEALALLQAELASESAMHTSAETLALLQAELASKVPPFPPVPEIEPFERAMLMPQEPPRPPTAPHPPSPARKWEHVRYSERDAEDGLYRAGTRHLDKREYGPAVEAFTAAAAKKGAKADGALYWKGYALAKLGRRDEAMAALNELEKSHAGSRWLNDAKALAVEIRQAGGQAVSPETQSDDDVKLIALNSIVQSDPDRALPVLEKILSRGGSPKLKEQALFVLAQSRSPQARDLVVQFAKGKGNPDIQLKAVEFLATQGGGNTTPILAEIYGSSNDVNLKQRILHSFMAMRDTDRLLNAAKNESNPELRRTAIQLVSSLGKSTQTSDALFSLYNSESDLRIKREILEALFRQQNISRIIEIARKETDPELRREAVRRVSMSKSKEANDFMIEILNK